MMLSAKEYKKSESLSLDKGWEDVYKRQVYNKVENGELELVGLYPHK